jgi:hypothetical protein
LTASTPCRTNARVGVPPPYRAFADAYDRDIDQIVPADRLGFREAWIGEHITERWENAPAPDLLTPAPCPRPSRSNWAPVGTLLAMTQGSDDPSWDHDSLRLLKEEVGPRIENLQ